MSVRTLYVFLVGAILALGCGLAFGEGANEPGLFGGLRGGATWQDRERFEYGQVAPDSNDAGTTNASAQDPEEFDIEGWGGRGEVYLGNAFSDTFSASARFSFTLFEQDDDFARTDGVASPAFWVPYLDAGLTVGGGARPLRAGIYGTRFRTAAVELDYESQIYDGGIDLAITLDPAAENRIRLIFGPAFGAVNQEFDYQVVGRAQGGGLGEGTIIQTDEDVDSFYGGAKLGAELTHPFSDCISFVGGFDGYLLYQSSELDGEQNVPGAGGTTISTIEVDDDEDEFAPRIEVRAGLTIRVSDRIRIGASYLFGAWFNAATVDNPEIVLVASEGDNRWVGDEAAHLGSETLLTHTAMVTIDFDF
ncbi:MAG: hypothetical protein HY720_07720 [Planctomycetes bacterium]|nr:hypothetical protein [Planctomycetota bacterium]